MSIRVLVLDRSKQTEAIVKQIISRLGYEVITATSVALAVFLARKNFPSVIVVDTQNEDDKLEFVSELKADNDLSHIPLLVVCNNKDLQRVKPAACRLGATHVLTHPLKDEALLSAIGPYLKEIEDNRPEETAE